MLSDSHFRDPLHTVELPDGESAAAATKLPLARGLPFFSHEAPTDKKIWLALALVCAALYTWLLLIFWAPADGGIDQNAYLVGGRLMAEHFTPRYNLPHPFAYTGGMFVRTEAGAYYPKYPIGLPLLYAICFWMLGATTAAKAAFLVSPLSTVAAVLGMFFIGRNLAGSFVGLLVAILLATSQVLLLLANNPNSHASCLAFVIWGMYALIRWWQHGRWWVGVLAGLLIGYACLIRYSEGLLILPIACVCLSRLRWKNWRSYFYCSLPGLAWALPVGLLLLFNHRTLGTLTGYDSSNESEFGAAFTWTKLTLTWEQMLRTLHDMGLFFILPIAVAGLCMLFRRSWQLGLMVLLWLLPGVALYTAYYFSPDRGIAYARFFLTAFPPALVGVAICFHDGILRRDPLRPATHSAPLSIAVGCVVAIAASVGVYRTFNGLQNGVTNAMEALPEESRNRRNLAATGNVLLHNVPRNSVLFADDAGFVNSPINYIQFLKPWELFSLDAFSTGGRRMLGGRGGGRVGGGGPFNQATPDAPTPIQPRQREYVAGLYKDANSDSLFAEQTHVIDSALQSGKHVFVVASSTRATNFTKNLRPINKYATVVHAKWSDLPPLDPPENDARNRGRNFFGGPGAGGPGGPGGFRRGGGFGNNAEATNWELVEIKINPNPIQK